MRNSMEIDRIIGAKQDYIWLSARPEQALIVNMLDKLVNHSPFIIKNFTILEICYEKTEHDNPYEEVVFTNTSDEGQMVDQIKDTSNYEDRTEWNRGTGNIFGEMKIKGMPGAKNSQGMGPESNSEKIWVKKMVTRRTIKKYQDVYKVRFDGSKDLHDKVEIETREEVLN